ncbi:MAG: hypothetical protein ACQ9MH_07150 [Nitrospinales bacterium]
MAPEEVDQIISQIAESYSPEEIREIRNEFQKMSGTIFDDDRSYESRMACFLEWFVLERIVPNTTETTIEKYIRTNREEFPNEKLNIYRSLTETIHGIFVTKKITPEIVTVVDMVNDEKYQVHDNGGKNMFQKNDVFEGRIISLSSKYYFTGNFCFHPSKATKYINSSVKNLRREQKKIYEEMAQLNRNLKSLEIKIKSVSTDIEKIKTKIEKASSQSKKQAFEEKLRESENNLSSIKDEQTMMQVRAVTWETKEVKIGCKNQYSQLIQKLSYMNLKWERSRQIDVRDIYKD